MHDNVQDILGRNVLVEFERGLLLLNQRSREVSGKDIKTDNSSYDVLDRLQPALLDADSKSSAQQSTRLSTRPEECRSVPSGRRLPLAVRNEITAVLTDMIHALVSSTLEKMADQIESSSLRCDALFDRLGQRPAIVKESSGEPLSRVPDRPNEMALRVGPLELDLVDRTARRDGRHINLRPREFQLLKYMMQRSGALLTRAALFKDVWHYKFVPDTNLVDVQLGRLRRKIDGANEAPMIRSVRGAGFVFGAAPLHDLSITSAVRSASPGVKSPA